MRYTIMFIIGLAFISAAIYLDNPAANKTGACVLFGAGLIILAILGGAFHNPN